MPFDPFAEARTVLQLAPRSNSNYTMGGILTLMGRVLENRAGELSIPDIIKGAMQELHPSWSQDRWAQAIGTARPNFNMILNGRAGISAPMALKMEKVLHLSADWLLKVQADWDLEAERERIAGRQRAEKRKRARVNTL